MGWARCFAFSIFHASSTERGAMIRMFRNPCRLRWAMLSRWRLALLAALLTSVSAAQDINSVPSQDNIHANKDATLQTYTKPFVSNADLVLVPVTVTDQTMRIVTGLEASNFAVTEDDYPQSVKYFTLRTHPYPSVSSSTSITD